ncbi:glycosyl hydrolase family 18 protein [Paenibacillus cymbidii]|uniref:glycosyl hydrolase family 18 protein n=1 Tax=Paenibacillus cymbidii TaxID=1639034 RepID=UPI00108164FD|nr:glycosyl hydrolase family 18 protein [Paenibacillus cymbidii]
MRTDYQTALARPPRRRRPVVAVALFLLVVALLLALAAGIGWYWREYWPNSEHAVQDPSSLKQAIYYQGERKDLPASGSAEAIKLPLPLIKELIDPAIAYDEASRSVIVTTQDKVIRLPSNQLSATVNEKPFALRFPVEKIGDTVYVPIEPLRDTYRVDIRESAETGAVLLAREGDAIPWGVVKADKQHPQRKAAMRTEPSIKATIAADLPQGEKVMIWEDTGAWYRIQRTNGLMGYAKKTDVALDQIETIPKQETKPAFVPWKPLGGKINLTWQQVVTKNPDTKQIPAMPGLNVISPQWFHLADGDGNLKNLADASFVKWAHEQGYQLWALFSNGFDPKITTDALSSYDKRMKMIKQLVSYVQMYQLQGINIDFENVYLKDKTNVVQFVRELTPFLHEAGVVVSIDVTVRDGSEVYSLFLDRRALGEVVDYMIVMTYDEHWSTSPTAGSVASLPWVEKGITAIMEKDDVPASKLVLGVPYYTRIWTEQTKDGKTSVTSKAVGMEAVQNLLKEKKLTPVFDAATGQNYVEYKEGDKTMKIWIEDAVSMKSRTELVKKLRLAGIASWSRTFETPDIWTLIKDTLEKLP